MIKIENLNKTYNYKKSNAFHALKDISLEIADGELTAIIGRSGAGKSTLLHIIGCIDTFESGTYTIDDISIEKLSDKKLAKIRNEKIGIVMQDFALVDEYSVLENVKIPLSFSKKKHDKSATALAMQALEKVGLADLARKSANKLSGGQKQRVAIARAIV
ncbi:MAG: ABC transporter ATP-binding protein, partial [Acutalibacteraceae bacterium]